MNNMDSWLKNMEEEANKKILAEEVAKKVKEDPEYQAKLKLLNAQIDMLNEKRKELDKEKSDLDVNMANKYLKEMGSKYRMVVKTKDDFFKDPFNFGSSFSDLFGKL